MTNLNSSTDMPIIFDSVLPSMVAPNTKQMLQQVARHLAPFIGIKERLLLDRILEQEKQKPSSMGEGIAIMHLHLSSLQSPMNLFVRLKNPVAMQSPDNQMVDILCVLLTPEREGHAYLRSLARLSRFLRDPKICMKLRNSHDEKSVRGVLEQISQQRMAA